MAFSLRSYRQLRVFIGAQTAAAATQEAAIRFAVASIANGVIKDWAQLAQSHNIQLNGIESSTAQKFSAESQLVGVYSGLATFFSELGKEYESLHQAEWTRPGKVGPFEEIARNVAFKPSPESMTVDYYRYCRNAIVHPDKSAEEAAERYFDKHVDDLNTVRQNWSHVGNRLAPSNLHQIAFADVKLLCRLALRVGREISEACDPGDEALARTLPVSNWRRLDLNEPRKLQRLIGHLRTEYGLELARAELVARMAMAD